MEGSLFHSYQLRQGSKKDQDLLVRFMFLTYQELFPQQQNFSHLETTVTNYFSSATPLWLVEDLSSQEVKPTNVGVLWLGTGIDQTNGNRYSHIFLLFVCPKHRRQGIGRKLMETAENWAKARGDRQIGLQVFVHNQAALHLYNSLGFQIQSLSMIKSFEGF
jgi:ribosomal protein S18 acetylase RimI-like enzyme